MLYRREIKAMVVVWQNIEDLSIQPTLNTRVTPVSVIGFILLTRTGSSADISEKSQNVL